MGELESRCSSVQIFCAKSKPTKLNDIWYNPRIPTGKDQFGAPNCPVFIPLEDNNAGQELSELFTTSLQGISVSILKDGRWLVHWGNLYFVLPPRPVSQSE